MPRLSFILVTAVALAWFCAKGGSTNPIGDDKSSARKKKVLPLFSVVTFANEVCTARSAATTTGTCLNSEECPSRGGTIDGNCAAGFGVCCIFTLAACGGTVSRNSTYITNVGFPSTITTTAQTCTYAVSTSADICQLRLDFDNMSLPIMNDGTCDGKFTATGPTGANPPTICGTNTGQHMYVETGRSLTATNLVVLTGAGAGARSWRIKVSQIECNSPARAPAGCTKYFTERSGSIMSFNFAGTREVAGQNTRICIRRAMGFCSTTYMEGVGTGDQFQLGNPAIKAAQVDLATCNTEWLTIPNSVTSLNTERYCGEFFSGTDASTVASPVTQMMAPFGFLHHTETPLATPGTGYRLAYRQNPC